MNKSSTLVVDSLIRAYIAAADHALSGLEHAPPLTPRPLTPQPESFKENPIPNSPSTPLDKLKKYSQLPKADRRLLVAELVEKHRYSVSDTKPLDHWHSIVRTDGPTRIGALQVLSKMDFHSGILPRGISAVKDPLVVSALWEGTVRVNNPNDAAEVKAVATGLIALFGRHTNKSERPWFHPKSDLPHPVPAHFEAAAVCLCGKIDIKLARKLIKVLSDAARLTPDERLAPQLLSISRASEHSVIALCKAAANGASLEVRECADKPLTKILRPLDSSQGSDIRSSVAIAAAKGLPIIIDSPAWSDRHLDRLISLARIPTEQVSLPVCQATFGNFIASQIRAFAKLGLVSLLTSGIVPERAIQKIFSAVTPSDIMEVIAMKPDRPLREKRFS